MQQNPQGNERTIRAQESGGGPAACPIRSGCDNIDGCRRVSNARDLAACQIRLKATQHLLASSVVNGFRDLPEAIAFAKGPTSPDSAHGIGGRPLLVRSASVIFVTTFQWMSLGRPLCSGLDFVLRHSRDIYHTSAGECVGQVSAWPTLVTLRRSRLLATPTATSGTFCRC